MASTNWPASKENQLAAPNPGLRRPDVSCILITDIKALIRR